jgi:hypothetical protein
MIQNIALDVDSSHYIFDTGLTFGSEVAKDILRLSEDNIQLFPKRNNYTLVNNPLEMSRLIGKHKTRELIRRSEQIKRLNTGKLINFSQYYLPIELSDKLINKAPSWLYNLSKKGPSYMLQVSRDGDYLGTHKGHKRKTSLFMLLKGNSQETRWYRNTESFEVIDPLRIPDSDKIEHVVSVKMELFKWYVFNHFEWHSVHNFNNGDTRVSIGIDFEDITTKELVSAVKSYVKNSEVI